LAPGVSEESKEKAKRELDDCNRQLEEIQPAVEEKQSDMQKYQVELQRSTQSLKAAKEHQKQYRTMMSKMQTSKRKLKAEEAKLEVDNEVDKKGSVDQLKRRLHASLQALDAHSEAFKKMMSATEKSSAAKLNKEVVLSAERQAR
jgi:chromosome segregation ATPase